MTVNLSALAGAGQQFFDNNGNPLSGGKLYSYAAGTTTPKTTYTSITGLTAHTNPIVLDSAGRVATGEIWLTANENYKFVLKTSAEVTIATWDNIAGINGTGLATNADLVEYDPPFTGAVATTVQDKLSEMISVKDFGAVGNGVADDTVAIQAALNSIKSPTGTFFSNSRALFFPSGTYLISSSLLVTSGQQLIGEGASSLLKAGGALTGQLVNLAPNINSYCLRFAIRNMGFECTGSVWAIKATADVIGNYGILEDLYFNCGFCVSLATYSQTMVVENLYSDGPLNQLLHLKGNRNYVNGLDKEGSTGTSTDPYVLIENHATSQSDGNFIGEVLIEGITSANKACISLVGVLNLILNNTWIEPTATNGYGLKIESSDLVQVTGYFKGITETYGKIRVATTPRVTFDCVDVSGRDIPLYTCFEVVDSTSSIDIAQSKTRRGTDLYPLSKLIGQQTSNIHVNQQIIADIAGNAATLSPISSVIFAGGNMLQNASFDAGMYFWTDRSGTGTPTISPSAVAPGLMLTMNWASSVVSAISQDITISAAQVGSPLTFTALVNANTGTGGFACPFISGCGATGSTGYSRSSAGSGWEVITQTFVPNAAGVMGVGVYAVNLTSISIDEVSLAFGTIGQPNQAVSRSYELNSKTFTTASAVPTTGTWKVGDHVFNSAPAVGSPKGWICTVAGTPGTWVSEGNL